MFFGNALGPEHRITGGTVGAKVADGDDALHVCVGGGAVHIFGSRLWAGRWVFGSPRLERFNGVPATNIQGEPAPGRSTGEAMAAMEELIGKLPPGIGYQWTGLSYQERMAQSQAGLLYAFSVLVIFLVLAALYESWTVPISIVLALPLSPVCTEDCRGLCVDCGQRLDDLPPDPVDVRPGAGPEVTRLDGQTERLAVGVA